MSSAWYMSAIPNSIFRTEPYTHLPLQLLQRRRDGEVKMKHFKDEWALKIGKVAGKSKFEE
jgi:hypothetical protein